MALSKTGRFLTKAEILGVGVFSPLSIYLCPSENLYACNDVWARYAAMLLSSSSRRAIRAGPTTTTTIFEFIPQGPIFHFWGTTG